MRDCVCVVVSSEHLSCLNHRKTGLAISESSRKRGNLHCLQQCKCYRCYSSTESMNNSSTRKATSPAAETRLYTLGDDFFHQRCLSNRHRNGDTTRAAKSPRRQRSQYSPRASSGTEEDSLAECDISAYFTHSSAASDRVVALAAAFNSSTALTQQGAVYRWGTENGTVFPVPTLVQIGLPRAVRKITCGRKHTLALLEGGIVMTWGTGYFGEQLLQQLVIQRL